MDLLAFERKLDSTIMRKRLEIQEALKRPDQIKVSTNYVLKWIIYNIYISFINSRRESYEYLYLMYSYQKKYQEKMWDGWTKDEWMDGRTDWWMDDCMNDQMNIVMILITQGSSVSVPEWELKIEGRLLDEVSFLTLSISFSLPSIYLFIILSIDISWNSWAKDLMIVWDFVSHHSFEVLL